MAYTINFIEPLEIVQVIYSGLVNLSERMKAVESVCNSYSHITPLKILVNVYDIEIQLSRQEQASFGQYLANHPVLSGARVAVLHSPTNNPNLLIDVTAFNNGYKLAQFNNNKEAEKWLSEI